MSEQSKHTALHTQHEAHGASFTDFGGWQMPLKYRSELEEHHTVRKAAGLFDLSHMGEVLVTGPQAAEFLNYALVSNLAVMAVGKAKYSLICTAEGGVIDDLITYRLAEDSFLVVPNASNAPVVAEALRIRASSFDVAVEDQSETTALVAVQGPTAEAVLLELARPEDAAIIRELKYYAAVEVDLAGLPVLLARTGYTGEDGFEIFIGSSFAVRLWDAALQAGEAHGLLPCGLAARDSLRLEAGMPLYGHELGLDTNPFEAGLGPVVSTKKADDFVGRTVLEPLKDVEPARRLVGLRAVGRRSARAGYDVVVDGVPVGTVTSGLPSPTLGYPVALAYVDAAHAALGTEVQVDLRGRPEPFTVVQTPFYKRQKQGGPAS
ncbi:glycine cleavage system aminomethyltransferase GcvT [Arthrobacter agilis]|uniref:glycine cleavage system aminomethyltransferase GcvT n=1 Tax=Arthrobacter agilis TaxID=37921 RepID=UPI000B3501BA|nr:glycine cleavage system aminomethyltransferase GcvT [Arthrobacter agilis]OUM42269.1 glycine cleavage system protein T [Arthrobacter agilis]PPB45610.1 glycine cleavage system protein T [Arthrobacter agilis]TPV26409.1 glycine cleavage system aminomethyltransferase GcvT [Arthrobacter agilis]VDR33697.1 Aminomethyltransferase [Arthrobacter agilis]